MTTQFGIECFTRISGNVTIGEPIGSVTVRHEAGNRGHMFLPLHLHNHGIAAANVVQGKADIRSRRGPGFKFGNDNADRDRPAIGQIKSFRHDVAGLIFPFVHKYKDAWPGIGTNF